MTSEAGVLIVDDEPEVREVYRAYLADEYAVQTVASGREALDHLEQRGDDIDVVLLDRRMPGMSGGEVLEAIQACGYDPRVVMVTAVDPDFDIVEMGFDDYVTKPVSTDSLKRCIEKVLQFDTYDEQLQEYYRVASKMAALEERKSKEELEASAEFQELQTRLTELRDQTDRLVEDAIENDGERVLFGALQ